MPAVDDRVRQVLDRIDRLPVLTDQQTEIPPRERGRNRLLVLLDRQPRMNADLADDPLEQLTHRRGKLALVDRLRNVRRRPVCLDDRDHARRCKADSEESALPL